MDVKLTLLYVVLLVFAALNVVDAEFLYNRVLPKAEELEDLGLKCIPGRTIIKIQEPILGNEDSDEDSDDFRRSHMNSKTSDESCQICVCSVEGKDEYCSNRPAMNVNECMRMASLMEKFKKNEPYEHERSLSFRIRRVGSKTNDIQKCIPFVSVYTDCNEENLCNGCSKCNCSSAGTWQCERIQECKNLEEEDPSGLDDQDIENALAHMREEIDQEERNRKKSKIFAPAPDTSNLDLLVAEAKYKPVEREENLLIEMGMMRVKRSVKENGTSKAGKHNRTVTFHNTLDEVNEDTLKNFTLLGTLKATKIEPKPQVSRRNLVNSSSSLHIEHTPPIFNPHAADNRVDTPTLHDDKEDLLIHHTVFEIVGNHSLATKDRDLSKVVVNEMQPGEEIIGDKNVKPVSNITFTPDNDTLTAVTFIAGNLLNQLWNMEKDANEKTMDTEHIKHRTINNLLDLFKEPLNLRQETFLKNALEQISTAMENKDVSNISLCENIEKLKQESLRNKPTEVIKSDQAKQLLNETGMPAEALSKINNALDLMSKYERVQKSLKDLKTKTGTRKVKYNTDRDKTLEHLTKNEEDTLNTFGNILGSITKLLMPNKKSKKFIKGLKNKSSFSNKSDLNEKLGNLNIDDLSLSDKDKIVLDYLKHIQNSPNCLLNKHKENPVVPSIEGNILLNLSEFFKIKSMSDLLKLAGTTDKPYMRSEFIETKTEHSETTTEYLETDFTTEKTTFTEITAKIDTESQFRATKNKFKSHLKTILQDLVELQNISGKTTNGKLLELSDALPCIYNLLNVNRLQSNKEPTKTQMIKSLSAKSVSDPSEKLTEIFENLKKELKYSQTRRTYIGKGPRPKSAAVLERTIKNIKTKVKTRRSMDVVITKSIEELKKIINTLDTSGSGAYKSVAFLAEVPPAERLLLLRTLALDTNRYVSVLKDIKQFISKMTTTPTQQYNLFEDFIDNVNDNVDLNEKVIKNLDKPKQNSFSKSNIQVRFKKVNSPKKVKEVENMKWGSTNTKLSREQILTQLIKNRIKYYISVKEASLDGNINSVNYDLAKKILFYLELGNNNLAKDLFKIFVSQNKQAPIKTFGAEDLDTDTYIHTRPKIERRIIQREPLIQFEEPKPVNKELSWANQDQLIKQLLTIQNMRS